MVKLVSDGFDWAGVSGRVPYAIFNLVVWSLVVAGVSLIDPFNAARSGVFVAIGLLIVPYFGYLRRRLRDVEWPGWLMLIAFVPFVGLLLRFSLLFVRSAPDAVRAKGKSFPRLVGICLAICIGLLAFSRLFWHPVSVVGGSMKPTFQPGDYVIVNRMSQTPERANLVIYRHPVHDAVHLGRIIGMPGDSVQMREGRLWLNGTQVLLKEVGVVREPFLQTMARYSIRCLNEPGSSESCEKMMWVEGGGYEILDAGESVGDNTVVFDVPPDHVFVLGDNRDNSLDSRFAREQGGPGMVPIANILGKPWRVLFNMHAIPGRIFERVK